MTVAIFSRSSFLQAHMKNRSYHSHRMLIIKLEGAGVQAAGRAWKLDTGHLVAELGSVEA
jgi:hypothetical protein